jgi:hypothetical protein
MLKSRRSEQGSIVVAMAVLMILGMLSVATATRSIANAGSVRRAQDYDSARAAADSGMSDGLYRIDQVQTASFTQSGHAGAGTWSYTAMPSANRNTWTVTSYGTVNGIKHGIAATIRRQSAYPYAIFTQQDLTLGGTNITSHNSITGATDTHDAAIGSNWAINISGNGGGDEQDYFTPYGECSNCGTNGKQMDGPRVIADPTQPSSGQSCPSGGAFNGNIDGQAGKTFLCNQDVSFGTVTVVSPPVQIYVGAGYQVDMSNASINVGVTSNAKDFILLKAGNGNFTGFNGSHSPSVTGVIYAPSSDITVNGGQMTMNGSMTLNKFTCNGLPNLALSYDDSLTTVAGSSSWKVSGWHEIASA